MKKILLGLACTVIVSFAYAQGSTTSTINGQILDAEGEAIIGAAVIAVNSKTGTQYGNITDVYGFYRIPNMKVGGPYEVTISFVGFSSFKKNDVYLTLGQTFKIDVNLSENIQELSEIVVLAETRTLFNGNRTGAETTISKTALESMPNASRTINDFTRLTPQAAFTSGGGISIAGTNNRFNSIFIDGATSNDVFGLAGNGQNGGQVGGLSLISVDALEQISVAVAPYDVTLGGFSGGGISAVTRSGSNDLEGSIYYFNRNDRIAGETPGFIEEDILKSDPTFKRLKLADSHAQTYGFRLGGPIIKDKLFFFINAESQIDETPNPFNFNSYTGTITKAGIDSLLSTLNGLGYDPGSYENTVSKLEAQKFLVKLDWNINKTHNLTIRHSYNNGENFSPNRSSTKRIRFENSGIFFPTTTNSSALELNSNFTNKSNKLIIGYTTVEDNRDPLGNPFPYVDIRGDQDIEFGSEQFSTANFLKQKIFTLTDNYVLYKGKHTITIGTHNEFYDINNVFIRQNFGSYDFPSIQDFIANVNGDSTGNATDYDRSYSLVDDVTGDDTKAAASFKAVQFGFYVQDEIQVNSKLKLNLGLRVDIPKFSDDPKDDGYFNNTAAQRIESAGYDLKGAVAGKAPSTQLLFAPRFGFNLDVNGDQSTQLRGGLGVFTSRVPFVWPGAMYNNNGATVGGVSDSGVDFVPDPFDQPTKGDLSGEADAVPQGQIDLFVKDFKFPQVFRTSIGIDQKLPWWGLVGSAEIIYTKTINNVFYENVNLTPSTENFTGADTRTRFLGEKIDGSYTAVYLGSNTSKGYTVNYSVGVTKPFENGFVGSLFYNFGRAEAIFEGTSSQNSSQWRGVYSVEGRNNAPLGRSDFDVASRIVANVSYKVEYGNIFKTTISLFYTGQSGSPFSYTYNDGFTGEDSRERALIYVPADASEIIFDDSNDVSAAEQWAALDAYISKNDYLSERKGKYAEKNMDRTPFTNIFDFRLLQDVFVNIGEKKNTIQLSFDIFNVGNLLNKDWGSRYFIPDGSGTSVQLLGYEGTDVDGTTPTFSFDTSKKRKTDFLGKDDSGLISSRWQMQFGIRYIFGN